MADVTLDLRTWGIRRRLLVCRYGLVLRVGKRALCLWWWKGPADLRLEVRT